MDEKNKTNTVTTNLTVDDDDDDADDDECDFIACVRFRVVVVRLDLLNRSSSSSHVDDLEATIDCIDFMVAVLFLWYDIKKVCLGAKVIFFVCVGCVGYDRIAIVLLFKEQKRRNVFKMVPINGFVFLFVVVGNHDQGIL